MAKTPRNPKYGARGKKRDVWLNDDGTVSIMVDDEVMERMNALREPGESDDDLVRRLVVAVKTAREEDAGPPADGREYRVRMSTEGEPGDLKVEWAPNGPRPVED